MSLRSDVVELTRSGLTALAAAHDHFAYSQQLWLELLTDPSVLAGRHTKLTNPITGSAVDDAVLVPTVNVAAELYLPSAAIGQFVSVTEAFVGDLIGRWLVEYPYHFKGTVDVQTVLSAPDRPAVLQLLADQFVGAMAYKSPRDWFKQLNAIVALGVPADAEVDAFAEIKATRDVFVHNRGIANDVYVRKAGPLARAVDGEPLDLPDPYVDDGWRACHAIVDAVGTAAAERA